ncbi:MAG: 1-deoxy-D-xylulose-5-phosphate reductoisomerase [Bacteroidia bacterium]|nr:1-deoxy-D-xylulose-5-phosphate reductoisomerase [Bacteroidia bacterium]
MAHPDNLSPSVIPPQGPIGISILGATGSIGQQALEVVAAHPGRFRVVALTAQSNCERLIAQALRYRPELVVIGDTGAYPALKAALAGTSIQVLAGAEGLEVAAAWPTADRVLTAVVGAAGLKPTVAAIAAGKTLCLANKETLVVAGAYIRRLAQRHGVTILPVDSEHSALFQALVGEAPASVHKLILTASGGPFRGYTRAQLAEVTVAAALKHPNWVMGAKITIDSASLLNKGLEVIEARWLFDVPAERIEVIIHPQSIVHSLVEFTDGSLKAQLGTPDMRLPIQYALAYPERLGNDFPRFRFSDHPSLTFEPADGSVFRALDLAFAALGAGGNRPCVFNAAGEVANAAFRAGRLPFLGMYHALEHALATVPQGPEDELEALVAADAETRALTEAFVARQPQPVS